MTRAEAIKHFESLGATVQSSVSSKTDLLIVGHEPGERKYIEALRKHVPILPWEMVLLSGVADSRPEGNHTQVPDDLLSELALTILITLDNIYAHCILSDRGGKQHATLWRAYTAGLGALNYLLQAAWGPSTGGSDIGLSGVTGPPNHRRSVALGRAVTGWKAVEILLIKAQETK
jgi:hypothetical protein